VEEEDDGVKVLRVYYRKRWVQTVSETVLRYCLVEEISSADGQRARAFRDPSRTDVERCDVVVATLANSRYVVLLRE